VNPEPKGAKAICFRKRRYPDELTACAFAIHCEECSDGADIYVYRCPVCSGYHLTRFRHSPDGEENRRMM
jgi:hypothetical protein